MPYDSRISDRVAVISQELMRFYPDLDFVPLHFSTPWELLVAVILSAQCTDVMVNTVTKDLFTKYSSIRDYAEADIREFESDIYSTGFYRNKAKNIIAAAQVIQNKYDGELPQTIQELVEIPGVGRKTANVVLGHLYGIVDGVVVDTHVKRLAHKFQLAEATAPTAIEKELMNVLPEDQWWDFPFRLKLYGQEYSPASLKEYSDPISQVLVEKNLLVL